jgi:hypothetical protein
MTARLTLFPWEFDHACRVGVGRVVQRWTSPDAEHYDPARMEDNTYASIAGAICELAVARWTNTYWPAHVWTPSQHERFRDLPDVGHNIEVKRVRTSLPAVRESQVGRRLVFWAARTSPDLHHVTLLGFADHDDAWEQGTPAPYDRTGRTRLVPAHVLRPPQDWQAHHPTLQGETA